MNSELIENISLESLEQEQIYDLFICAAGFENRAIFVATRFIDRARKSIALGFDHNKCLSYQANIEFFRKHGVEVREDVGDAPFSGQLNEILTSLEKTVGEGSDMYIAIDISCFDRYRLAEIVSTLSSKRYSSKLVIDIWYSIAEFDAPRGVLGRNEFAGPVHKNFAGRFSDPSRPLALIAGLGYEMGKVMGAAEFLQASRVISFFPESPISEFAPEVEKANKLLLRDVAENDSLHYPVADPRRTVAMLDSVIRGLGSDYNIVILPGGPKIFVFSCMLVQRIHRAVSVWRVSTGRSIRAREVRPSGYMIGMRWRPGIDVTHFH